MLKCCAFRKPAVCCPVLKWTRVWIANPFLWSWGHFREVWVSRWILLGLEETFEIEKSFNLVFREKCWHKGPCLSYACLFPPSLPHLQSKFKTHLSTAHLCHLSRCLSYRVLSMCLTSYLLWLKIQPSPQNVYCWTCSRWHLQESGESSCWQKWSWQQLPPAWGTDLLKEAVIMFWTQSVFSLMSFQDKRPKRWPPLMG